MTMEAEVSPRYKRIEKWIGPTISVIILTIALWFLRKEFDSLSKNVILEHIHSIPSLTILLAGICAALSYCALTMYDALAVRYVGKKIAFGQSTLTAFIACSVAHNVGLAALSGGAVRYRMYTLRGLSKLDIATIVAFVTLTFVLGASTLLGLGFALMPNAQMAILKLSPLIINSLSVGLIALPLLYLATSLMRRSPISIYKWKIVLPKPQIAIGQVGLGICDIIFAAATLFILLSPHTSISFLPFLGIFLLGMTAGIASSIPGGIGVFEAVLIATLPQIDKGVLLATIIVYRIIYYAMPLAIAMVLLLGHELHQHFTVSTRQRANTL